MQSQTTSLNNRYHGGPDTGYLIFDVHVAVSEANRRVLEGQVPVASADGAGIEVRLPWDDMVELVLNHLRSERISALEQAEGDELKRLLGL
jgi:hypothetical protein